MTDGLIAELSDFQTNDQPQYCFFSIDHRGAAQVLTRVSNSDGFAVQFRKKPHRVIDHFLGATCQPLFHRGCENDRHSSKISRAFTNLEPGAMHVIIIFRENVTIYARDLKSRQGKNSETVSFGLHRDHRSTERRQINSVESAAWRKSRDRLAASANDAQSNHRDTYHRNVTDGVPRYTRHSSGAFADE